MKKLLAACRRIFLAGCIGILLLVGWVLWQAPSLNEMRPQLEKVLAQQFGLQSLHLGKLSWRWAGYTWLSARNITFTGPAERIRVADAQLEVRLSSWDLLIGNIRPTSISLRHGKIALLIPHATSGEMLPIPAGLLHIEDSTVTLRYGKFSNRFEHLDLHLDATRRNLAMQMPGFSLNADWDKKLQPQHVHARFDNLNWLPEAWRLRTRGAFNVRLDINQRPDNTGWKLDTELNSDTGTSILDQKNTALFAFNHVHLQAHIHAGPQPTGVQRVEWQTFEWRYGKDHLSASGDWHDEQLNLAVQSETLHIKTVADWVQPVANPEWHAWLNGLRGTAQDLHATLRLKQKSAWQTPEWKKIRNGDIQMTASIHHASLPLNPASPKLENLNGQLELNANGLNMAVQHVELPHQAGTVHGTLHINDLIKPVFSIQGRGQVDVGRCQQWLNPEASPQVHWGQAPADARFAFEWPIVASQPDKGKITLTPQQIWHMEIMQRPILLHDGNMQWQADGSLKFTSMQLEYDGLKAALDMQLKEAGQTGWHLHKLRLQSEGDFADIATRFHMPVDGASGRYNAQLTFDKNRTVQGENKQATWQLHADLRQAAWQRLLGSHKNKGQPYTLQLIGQQNQSGFDIKRIRSRGGAPFVIAKGNINKQRLALHISTLKAPAFSGDMTITAPFHDAPMEININSDFLDQSALPDDIPDMRKLVEIPASGGKKSAWVIRGNFRHIRWDAISIRGVQVNFASSTQGIGTLQADALDAGQLSIRHVHSFFHLSSGDNVDIRNLTAEMLGQKLQLSGNLHPEPGGGLRWTGFSTISGNFSQIIHRLDASKLFQGGMVHAFWSGSGVIKADRAWWNAMHGRLRLRSDKGRILEGGTMTKMLAALSLADLPHFLTGKRKDMSGPGMLYKRLQLESTVNEEKAEIRRLAMRASALDLAGRGKLNLADGKVDLYVTARPLQNLDSFLRMIPLLRDVILGAANSVFRKIYHVYGPLQNAKVEAVSPKQAGLPESGLLETLINLPGRWFDSAKKAP